MNFEPLTDIYFCHTGIDENNKVKAGTQDELFAVITRGDNIRGRTYANSFQRADGFFMIRVDHDSIPYYNLLGCDTVLYMNKETSNAFWIVGNILSIEWKNPDCSFVRFKIDNFMTYQPFIDWSKTWAYIEREHVKEDWASDGGKPVFTNCGPAEDMNFDPDTPIFAWSKGYQCDKVVVLSPYDTSGDTKFEGSIDHGLYSSLNTQVLDAGEVNAFFKAIAENKKCSINNIVGVYGIPSEFESAITGRGSGVNITETLPPIDEAVRAKADMPELNNAKCMTSPYMTVKLYSSSGDALTFNTQWFGNEVNGYELHICAAGAGGLLGGIAAAFNNQNGTFDWKTYNDFMVMIHDLPSCPHTLDGYADWQSVNGMTVAMRSLSTIHNGVTGMLGMGAQASKDVGIAKSVGATGNTIGAVAGFAAADMIGSGLSMGADLAAIGAQVRQAKSSGATIAGIENNTCIFDLGLSGFGQSGGWGFKVIYYTIQPYLLRCVDACFDRFGYRVHRNKKIDLENRPIWTYIQTIECHVAGGARGVPFVAETAINAMFNRGVTIWNKDKYLSGQAIGDFSDAKGNRGIRGKM